MTQYTDSPLWVLTTAFEADGASDLSLHEPAPAAARGVWRSADGSLLRAYHGSRSRPGPAWQPLQLLQEIAGASAGSPAPFHYVVETDVLPEHAEALNDWYTQEHLPGLAAVPGTVRAARYLRLEGAPKFYACYDLTSPDTLRCAAWLAVRHTAWSSLVRPMFRNTRRTEFVRVEDKGRTSSTR
jgi:hypothetical protein